MQAIFSTSFFFKCYSVYDNGSIAHFSTMPNESMQIYTTVDQYANKSQEMYRQ